MKLEFQEYRPRRIVNVRKHVDGPWFWDKYSAHPYIGCRSGCEFCYLRGSRYLGRRDPESFDTLIQVKSNAAELLRKELARLEPDVIACGDWQQPAEDRYRLSRSLLEVVLELGFPLFVVERSPLLARDLDLLVEIHRRSWVGLVFSISNLDPALKQAFEPRSPGVQRRLEAMRQLADAGLLVGTTLMPIIPAAGDRAPQLEEVVVATRDHGGSFVLGGGLSMEGVQADRTLEAALRLDLGLERPLRRLYGWQPEGVPRYGPPREYAARLGRMVRELCEKHGLRDRMPRYIPAGPLAVNKRLAEQLFLKTYDLELERAATQAVWAFRKAAWAVDELASRVDDLYRGQGLAGLESVAGIGPQPAEFAASWLQQDDRDKTAARLVE
ncbi:MAG TPA: radical SAM protein [Anaerolineales bacterium]|nr:radical SAM protein [Anaerolineales bacterium]